MYNYTSKYLNRIGSAKLAIIKLLSFPFSLQFLSSLELSLEQPIFNIIPLIEIIFCMYAVSF